MQSLLKASCTFITLYYHSVGSFCNQSCRFVLLAWRIFRESRCLKFWKYRLDLQYFQNSQKNHQVNRYFIESVPLALICFLWGWISWGARFADWRFSSFMYAFTIVFSTRIHDYCSESTFVSWSIWVCRWPSPSPSWLLASVLLTALSVQDYYVMIPAWYDNYWRRRWLPEFVSKLLFATAQEGTKSDWLSTSLDQE